MERTLAGIPNETAVPIIDSATRWIASADDLAEGEVSLLSVTRQQQDWRAAGGQYAGAGSGHQRGMPRRRR